MTFCTLVSFAYITSIGLAVGMKQIAEPRCLIRFYSIDNAKSMKFAMIATPIFLGISLGLCLRGRRPRPWDGYGPGSRLSHQAHG